MSDRRSSFKIIISYYEIWTVILKQIYCSNLPNDEVHLTVNTYYTVE